MYNQLLRKELTALAHKYGSKNYGQAYAHTLIKSTDAVIFNDVSYNFHKESWKEIFGNSSYLDRTKKIHSHLKSLPCPAIYEMQSSNSSDALTMNIFCHPIIKTWAGVCKLLKVNSLSAIEFGVNGNVKKIKNGVIISDTTEIDIRINNSIICECKLTEKDFTSHNKTDVERYLSFEQVFHKDKLLQTQTEYKNYQLIRNILAARQIEGGRFILFCDMRRPDLAQSFFHTVNCIQDRYIDLRTNCEIIYWQDVAHVVGKDLKDFLEEKYGISSY